MKARSPCRPSNGRKLMWGIIRRLLFVLVVATTCAVVNLDCGVKGFQQQPACFGLRQHRTLGYAFPRLFTTEKPSTSTSEVKMRDDESNHSEAVQKKEKKTKRSTSKRQDETKMRDKSKKEQNENSKSASLISRPEKRPLSKRRRKKAQQKIEKLDNIFPENLSEAVQEQERIQRQHLENGKQSKEIEVEEATIEPNASMIENESQEAVELGQVEAEQVAADASDLGQHAEEEEYTQREEQLTQQELLEENSEQLEAEQIALEFSGTLYEEPAQEEEQRLQQDHLDEESVQIGVAQASVGDSELVYEEHEEEETYVSPSDFSIAGHFKLTTPLEDEFHLEENQRLVCIGDVHGDFHKFEESLKVAGVYDETNEDSQWVGGNTILVQCGDILDRGSQELACFSLLANLSRQATEHGGHVIVLYGNHEVLNAAGLFHYTEGDEEYEEVLGHVLDGAMDPKDWRGRYAFHQPVRWAAYEPGGLLSQSLMTNLKVVVKVGRTVCVHAGLTADHINEFGGLSGMNRAAKEWISQVVGMEEAEYQTAQEKDEETAEENEMYATNIETGEIKGDVNGEMAVMDSGNGETSSEAVNSEIEEADYEQDNQEMTSAEAVAARQAYTFATVPPVLGGGVGELSPIWMRDYSSPSNLPPNNSVRAQKMIDECLDLLDCDRMVMGHTVQREINCALNGKAWRVDIGASRGVMDGNPEVLEVCCVDGNEVVTVLSKKYGRIPEEERQIFEFNAATFL